MNRRDFLETCVAPAWLATATTVLTAATVEERRINFVLKETAGLRRFGYPVHVNLPIEFAGDGLAADGFVLVQEGQDVPAQFRRVTQPDGSSRVALDFNASHGAFEVRKYTVHHNSTIKLGAVKGRGMDVRTDGSTLVISHSPHITYAVSEDLAGFVRSVKIPSAEFITKADSSGLFVVVKGQKVYLPAEKQKSKAGSVLRISRQGPLAVGLESRHPILVPGSESVASMIDLNFPVSKSWIETVWILNDPENQIETMGLDLDLQVEQPPILLDCGAKSTVYVTLKEHEMMTFEAGNLGLTRGIMPGWIIQQGTAGKSEVLAMMRSAVGNEPEGWVHVIEGRRCTAMAVAGFGEPSLAAQDRFEIHGNGRFRFERRFPNEDVSDKIERPFIFVCRC